MTHFDWPQKKCGDGITLTNKTSFESGGGYSPSKQNIGSYCAVKQYLLEFPCKRFHAPFKFRLVWCRITHDHEQDTRVNTWKILRFFCINSPPPASFSYYFRNYFCLHWDLITSAAGERCASRLTLTSVIRFFLHASEWRVTQRA